MMGEDVGTRGRNVFICGVRASQLTSDKVAYLGCLAAGRRPISGLLWRWIGLLNPIRPAITLSLSNFPQFELVVVAVRASGPAQQIVSKGKLQLQGGERGETTLHSRLFVALLANICKWGSCSGGIWDYTPSAEGASDYTVSF